MPTDHRTNPFRFLDDGNRWSAGTTQKQLRKNKKEPLVTVDIVRYSTAIASILKDL